ncbi:hypothetical protein [Micromonospora sp. NPDC003776]
MTDTTPRPRSPGLRLLLAALIDTAVLLASFGVFWLVDAETGREGLARAGALLPLLAFAAWLAPRVSYRRRDALLVFVAGYVVFVIAWRLAYLPYRDWTPRPDEVAQARWAAEPEHAGTWRAIG